MNGSIATIKGFPEFSVYSASKAAVRSFARLASRPKGTQNKGERAKPGNNRYGNPGSAGGGRKAILFTSLIPRGEIGRPEEIATAALFLGF